MKYVPSAIVKRHQQLSVLPDLNVEISGDVFLKIAGWSTTAAPNETAGHAILKDGVVVWACQAEIASAGSSVVDSGTMESVLAAIQAGYGPDDINVQWHTHPTFGAFHSGTDDENEMKVVEPLSRQSPTGSFYFIVASGFDWCVRKYVWYETVLLGYHEGYVTVPEYGIKLNQGRTKAYTYSSSYKPATYKSTTYTPAKQYPLADLPAVDVIDVDQEFTIPTADGDVKVIYLTDQIPPCAYLLEVDCIPLFIRFGIQPFRWNELAKAVWALFYPETTVGETAVELARYEEEKEVLLKAIVEGYLDEPDSFLDGLMGDPEEANDK